MSVSTTQRYVAVRAGMKILGLPCFTHAVVNKLLYFSEPVLLHRKS